MTLRNDDLEPSSSETEHAALDHVAAMLSNERPRPAPAFRGRLRRDLAERRELTTKLGARARRRLALASIMMGALLLGFAGSGLVDVGPLAPANDVQQTSHFVASR